jgi:hypothetical protein
MPGKAADLWEALGQSGAIDAAAWTGARRPDLAGSATRKPEGLFPKPAAG